MAEIDLQEKKRSIWPWILGLLALILVIWLAAEMLDDDPDAAITDPVAEQTMPAPAPGLDTDAAMPPAVTQFEESCGSASTTTEEMSLDHTYVENCVRQMTAAMEAVIQRDTVDGQPLNDQLQDYRGRAEQLTANRDSPEHSSYLRGVFDGAAQIVARIEEVWENAGETLDRRSGRVQDAAAAFSGDAPLMEQRDEVAAFFRETASALRAMAASRETI